MGYSWQEPQWGAVPDPSLRPTEEDRETAILNAELKGRTIVYGEPYTLQLDIDSEEQHAKARELIQRFRGHIGVKAVEYTVSKSGHWHFYVRLSTPMPRAERLFWQAALGSDRVREALNWLWMADGNEGECFLIELRGAQMLTLDLDAGPDDQHDVVR